MKNHQDLVSIESCDRKNICYLSERVREGQGDSRLSHAKEIKTAKIIIIYEYNPIR